MPDEKQDTRRDDEIEDEMPNAGEAPCGDIFAVTGVDYVTDADADAVGDQQDA